MYTLYILHIYDCCIWMRVNKNPTNFDIYFLWVYCRFEVFPLFIYAPQNFNEWVFFVKLRGSCAGDLNQTNHKQFYCWKFKHSLINEFMYVILFFNKPCIYKEIKIFGFIFTFLFFIFSEQWKWQHYPKYKGIGIVNGIGHEKESIFMNEIEKKEIIL